MNSEKAIEQLHDLQDYSRDTFIRSKNYVDALGVGIKSIVTLDHLKKEIQRAMKINNEINSQNAIAQNIALEWVYEQILQGGAE